MLEENKDNEKKEEPDTGVDVDRGIAIDVIVAVQLRLQALSGVQDVTCTGRHSTATNKDKVSENENIDDKDMDVEKGACQATSTAMSSPDQSSAYSSLFRLPPCCRNCIDICISYLTGAELASEIPTPSQRIHVILNETNANGTGTRTLIREIQLALPSKSGLVASVAPQGSFLLANMARDKHERELSSLGRTTSVAMIFTIYIDYYIIYYSRISLRSRSPAPRTFARSHLTAKSEGCVSVENSVVGVEYTIWLFTNLHELPWRSCP
jgi:hypothetical protein